MALPVPDDVPDGHGAHQHLGGEHAAALVDARYQLLGDDALNAGCQLGDDLGLLVGREDVDDAIDGAHAVGGVERREDEVSGLGGGQRGGYGLQVAHLPHTDDIGVHPQDVRQRRVEGPGVGADLLLDDHALAVGVAVLHRVLDRDDPGAALPVDLIDERGHGRRLPDACRPGNEDEADMGSGELEGDLRQAELGDPADDGRAHADGALDTASRVVERDSEVTDVGEEGGHAETPAVLELLDLLLSQHGIDELSGGLALERLVLGRRNGAVHAQERRQADDQVDVRGPTIGGFLQQGHQVSAHPVLLSCRQSPSAGHCGPGSGDANRGCRAPRPSR